MVYKKECQRDKNERREDALRPSRYLGYDHDSLGMHLVSREAYKIAVHCFRRAIWLNPFEPVFKKHLALCLYKLERNTEAIKRPDNKKDR
ncbi:MAG: hypothetical protein WBL85_08890 [Sedimentisphaerales bacterium]